MRTDASSSPRLGVVIIGRNEGHRLVRCLASVEGSGATVVYVDSGSTDDSVASARRAGAAVVALDTVTARFSAARARNAGYRRVKELDPDVEFVQFIDGDCEVIGDWLGQGVRELEARPGAAIVAGRVIERHPEASVYNRLCQLEWQRMPGEIDHCGGIFVVRAAAFEQVGGFREDVVAGEEPELCVRLRAAGWKVVQVDADMVWHDTAMFRFSQWWTRMRRAGHAYAQGAAIHGRAPERHCVRECRRMWVWGCAVPALAVVPAYWTHGASLALLCLYPLLAYRTYRYGRRRGWRAADAWLYAGSCVVGKVPGLLGMLQFRRNQRLGRQATIIEYKAPPAAARAPDGGRDEGGVPAHAGRPAAAAAAGVPVGLPADWAGVPSRCIHPGCERVAVDGLCDVHRRQFSQRELASQAERPDGVPAPREVAYLVNQYPHTSHSFIRREIHALERAGVKVRRFTVRRSDAKLVDPADVQEAELTRVILDYGLRRLLLSVARRAATAPSSFAKGLRLAVSLGRNSDRGVLRHLIYLAQASLLADWFDESPVDHLHAHFGTNPAAVAAICHALGGPTYSFSMHGPEEFDKPGRLALGRKVAGATMVAAISEFTRSQLYRWCSHEHWDKIHVVRCGLDATFLDQPPVPAPAAPRLVCVGRLCEQKGQINLVRAAAELAAEGLEFELVLVGDGPMRSDLEAFVDRHNLRGVVTFAGWQSGQQVRATIQSSRALVLPSFAEGLPVVLMEALALHRPVISTYIAGIPELVEDGVSGWLCPAGSVEELKRAMREAVGANPARLDAMGRAGAVRVHERHDAATEARKLASLFPAAAAAGGRPARAPAAGIPVVAAAVDASAPSLKPWTT